MGDFAGPPIRPAVLEIASAGLRRRKSKTPARIMELLKYKLKFVTCQFARYLA